MVKIADCCDVDMEEESGSEELREYVPRRAAGRTTMSLLTITCIIG